VSLIDGTYKMKTLFFADIGFHEHLHNTAQASSTVLTSESLQ